MQPLPSEWVEPSGRRATLERHGMRNTRAYSTWAGMHGRCRHASATGYENYGGKGIRVCERWYSFSNFYADMGDPPDGHSIERIDGTKNYEPGNCCWTTRKAQNRNQHDLLYLTFQGRTQCLSAWAEELGLAYAALRGRVRRGWPPERVLSVPIRPHKPYERRPS